MQQVKFTDVAAAYKGKKTGVKHFNTHLGVILGTGD